MLKSKKPNEAIQPIADKSGSADLHIADQLFPTQILKIFYSPFIQLCKSRFSGIEIFFGDALGGNDSGNSCSHDDTSGQFLKPYL
jgi:hypothetical protein